ncbi:class I SAM-dependent methyltransferase [Algoriphagus persicinus]|uniref:class I SAM-dependent methyltransferase n=1 Tax=Algoriphagus persicinus TaxID=3108754 RepID=UPI002B3E99A6|nr:class I SAM-dependent methyltransferase [Algoriphagus sp. E1-3-M2]MEB2785338.1 class I SAM-dependent methyltransferase [Algoriphagus sp. E1-3-M2]
MEATLENHWETVYQTKDTTKVGWHQTKPQVSLDFIGKTQLSKDAAILDVGGGDSKLVDYLLEDEFQNITVLDISDTALGKIKQRLKERQVQVKFVVSNILDFNPIEKFSLWHDRAVFHFLTAEKDQNEYLSLVQKSIDSGGYLILATFSKSGPSICSGLPVKQYDIQDLEEFFRPEFHLLEGINYDHITPAGSPQNYSVCLFQRI